MRELQTFSEFSHNSDNIKLEFSFVDSANITNEECMIYSEGVHHNEFLKSIRKSPHHTIDGGSQGKGGFSFPAKCKFSTCAQLVLPTSHISPDRPLDVIRQFFIHYSLPSTLVFAFYALFSRKQFSVAQTVDEAKSEVSNKIQNWDFFAFPDVS